MQAFKLRVRSHFHSKNWERVIYDFVPAAAVYSSSAISRCLVENIRHEMEAPIKLGYRA